MWTLKLTDMQNCRVCFSTIAAQFSQIILLVLIKISIRVHNYCTVTGIDIQSALISKWMDLRHSMS